MYYYTAKAIETTSPGFANYTTHLDAVVQYFRQILDSGLPAPDIDINYKFFAIMTRVGPIDLAEAVWTVLVS